MSPAQIKIKFLRLPLLSVISNPDDVHMLELESEIYEPIRELTDEFGNVLYGGNDELFREEINEIDDDFIKLGIHKFVQKLRGQKISIDDCEPLLNNRLDMSSVPADDVFVNLRSSFSS